MINLKKSQPAPECLENEKKKASGKYNCGDVLERLEKDCFNKCYLCEDKYLSNINIEHFIPHQYDENLKI